MEMSTVLQNKITGLTEFSPGGRSQGLTKVNLINLEENMNVCTEYNGNPI